MWDWGGGGEACFQTVAGAEDQIIACEAQRISRGQVVVGNIAAEVGGIVGVDSDFYTQIDQTFEVVPGHIVDHA